MKTRIASILGLVAILFAVSFAQAANKEIKIKTNADCDQGKQAIEKALKATDGVTEATLDVKTKTATVKYDDAKTNPTKIRKAIVASGFNADKMKAKANCSSEKCKDAKNCKDTKNCKDEKNCKDSKHCKDAKAEFKDKKADAKADCKDAKATGKCSKSCKDKKSCEKPTEVK